MNHFVTYFLSGFAPANLAAVKKSAIGDLLSDITDDRQCVISPIAAGPDGVPGVLVCIPPEKSTPDDFGYFADRQEWHQSTDGVWVGWHKSAVIRPKDLLRRQCPVSDFELVEFADGSQWEVPVLRDPSGGGAGLFLDAEQHTTSMKSAMYRRPDGSWVRAVTGQYVDLFNQSRQWFDWLLTGCEAGKQVTFAYSDVFEYSVAVLGLHYRYGLHLNDALQGRFLQTDEVSQILSVSCGWTVVNRYLHQKKNTPVIPV